MKTKLAVLIAMLLAVGSIFWAQTHSAATPASPAGSSCALDRSDLQDELKDLQAYTARMQSRIAMLRSSAGIVQDPQLRNALQVDGEMWEDQLDISRKRMKRLQAAIDRCEAREKIRENSK